MGRPKHPRKELEAVLKSAERQGWTVTKGRYYKMKCPCPDKHVKTVKNTPSDPNYARNLLGPTQPRDLLEGAIEVMWKAELAFVIEGGSDTDDLEMHLDRVLELLDEDPRIVDADYLATLATSRVEWTLSTEATSEIGALSTTFSALRAAIHAAAGATPGWEERYRKVASHIRDAAIELADA